MCKDEWLVQLGEREWSQFTYARASDDALRLLGSVRRGARVGALAVTSQGEYLQVNGDHLSPLGKGQMQRALAKATKAERRPRAPKPAATAPVVIVKRRRTLVRE